MSDLPGNPYAERMSGPVVTKNLSVDAIATMALAYEQRTANLIAFARLELDMADATHHFGDGEIEEIAERLNLA